MKQRTNHAAAIEAELARLDHFPGRKKLRDVTIRALAEASATGVPPTTRLGEMHEGIQIIGKRAYYDKNRRWYHDLLFREVLNNVINIYHQRDNEERERIEAAARETRHKERAAIIRRAKAQLVNLIDKMSLTDNSPSQVASYMKAVLEAEMAEFNELPTHRARITQGTFAIDLNLLNDEELERVAQGEDPFAVIADRLLALPQPGAGDPDSAQA